MDNIDKKKNKALLLGTLIYAIGNFGTKFLSFLIVPLYTYYINPSDLGDYDLLMTTVNLLTPLLTMQIADAAYRWMIANEENQLPCVSATYKLLFKSCTISSAIILLINYFFPIKYCYYFIGILVLSRILESLQKLLRGLKNQKLYAASGIFYTFSFVIMNLVRICYLKQGIEALFKSALWSYGLAVIFILCLEKRLRKIDLKNNQSQLQKEMLHYSIPLIPNSLNWWIMNASDRYVIRFFLGRATNGIYSVAYKFPSILSTIFLMFNTSWQDLALSDNSSKEDTDRYYTKVFQRYYRLSFSMLLVLVPLTKIVSELILSKTYKEAASYISFLYLGTVFQGFSSFYGVGYLKGKTTKGAATTSVFGGIVNILVNVLLIKKIGLHAASFSTFCGFFVMWIMRVYQTRDTVDIKIKLSDFLSLFALSLGMCLVVIWSNTYLNILLTLVAVILFLVLNYNEIRMIVTKVVKRKQAL